MNITLKDMKEFDIPKSTVSLWVFKKSMDGKTPRYTGRWIELDENLDQALKTAAEDARAKITETIDYAILAQNNESSALTLPLDETYGPLFLAETADETVGKQVRKIKDINNTDFYVVKFTVNQSIFYGIRKTDTSWKAKKSKDIMSVIYKEEKLSLDDNAVFSISKYFDFFILDNTFFISGKQSFESVLCYKQGHINAFIEMQKEVEFKSLFSDITPLKEFVGDNKIQLRRASAIQQKGHYKNPTFMNNLRHHYRDMRLNLEFDDNGKIIATPENCRDIFIALLDHRLDSRLSSKLYDVQNTEDVSP